MFGEMRHSAIVVLAVLLAACGSSDRSQTTLTMVALNTTVGRAEFHLRCGPRGGDLPQPERACAALASDPRLLTESRPFVCAGGPFSWWDVTVTGRVAGQPVTRNFSTCWTPQMTLIGRLGLSWKVLQAHLVTRRVKHLHAGEHVVFSRGTLRPTDLVTCTIAGHELSVGVPEITNSSASSGYGGSKVQGVDLEVARLPDGSVTASCHAG